MVLNKAYRIYYDLETRFSSLRFLNLWRKNLTVIRPEVPRTAMDTEDSTTPRVCAALTVEDCMTAIKPAGTLRRCLYNQDDDLMDYENASEVYPAVVCSLEGSFITPSRTQVPDVKNTRELWSLDVCKVIDASLIWLGRRSVQYEDERVVSFTPTSSEGKDHPWLNGRGHPLLSSAMGAEPWPPRFETHGGTVFLDNGIGQGGLVSLIPHTAKDGYGIVRPVDGRHSYRERLDWLREHTGFHDIKGVPIFNRDWVSVPGYPKLSGFTVIHDGAQWVVEANDGTVFPLCDAVVKSLELHRTLLTFTDKKP